MLVASYVLLGSTFALYSSLFVQAYRAYKHGAPDPFHKSKMRRNCFR